MPGFNSEFSVLPVGHRLPPGGECAIEIGLDQIVVNSFHRDSIHTCAQGFAGAEVIRRALWINVDVDNLCLKNAPKKDYTGQQQVDRCSTPVSFQCDPLSEQTLRV